MKGLTAIVREPRVGLLLCCAVGFSALGFVARHPGSVPDGILWLLSHLLAVLWLATGVLICKRKWRAGPEPAEATALPPLRERLRAFLASSDTRLLLLILVLSMMMRFADLERMPWGYAGIHIDAAYNSEISFRILDGRQYFSPVLPGIAYYRDALIHYYLLPFFAIFGRDIEALRLAMNFLALLNIVLMFLILRRCSSSRPVIFGCTAFYGLWGCDIIFSLSGVEYVMVTPLLLGSFYLLLRTMESGSVLIAVNCGLVWGLGFSTHYSYMGFSLAVLAMMATRRFVSRECLRAFIPGAIWGVLPKAGYLLFGYSLYSQRIADVLRHDDEGRILVAQALWGNLNRLWNLLFVDQIYDKWYLPFPKLFPALAWPLLILGLWMAVRCLRQPQHFFAVLLSGIVIAANLLTYPMDYRWMNWIPVMVILFAAAAEAIRAMKFHREAWMLLWWILMGGLLIRSTADYFHVRPDAGVMGNYACVETAQARSIVGDQPLKKTYLFAPKLTYRTALINRGRLDILDANYELDAPAQVARSAEGEAIIIRNIQRIVEKNRASNDADVIYLWVSHESPYREMICDYMKQHFQVNLTEHRITEPVGGTTLLFTRLSFFTP